MPEDGAAATDGDGGWGRKGGWLVAGTVTGEPSPATAM